MSINETSQEVETNSNVNNQVEVIENESNSKLKIFGKVWVGEKKKKKNTWQSV